MSCCDHCEDAGDFFSRKAARREAKKYRRRGPASPTKELLRLLQQHDVKGRTLLDIGGGIGAIQHELLRTGVAHATHVDASPAYLDESAEEATRQGHRDRASYVFADFVEAADGLPSADIVTLDRVVCCYPDMPGLIAASAAKSRNLYALTYPRPRWGAHVFSRLGNLYFRMRGSAFRTYMHAPAEIARALQASGLTPIAEDHTFVWHVAVYQRK